MSNADSRFPGTASVVRRIPALQIGLALGLAAIVFTLLASPAAASKGVVGFIGSTGTGTGNTGGVFSTPTGVAVNTSGNGGAAAGDIYVVDRSNARVQQFSATGQFIRAWGKDVIVNTPPLPPNANGELFEICDTTKGNTPAHCKNGSTAATSGNVAGGTMNNPHGIAVNQETGNVYVSDQTLRIQEYDATGNFIRAWGQDAVASGPGNAPSASAKQTLTVDATEGTFKLSFQGQVTGDLAFDAGAAAVQAALQGLSTIGSGNATVAGGPGSAGGGTPYVITFAGALANAPMPLISASNGSTALGGGASTATVVTTTKGSSGFEICSAVVDTCKIGVTGNSAGAFASTFSGHPAVAPAGTSNAGNVLVADSVNRRVQEFTENGEFVRAFGWDVAKPYPFGNTPQNEVQQITVTATAGTFKLTFGGNTTAAVPFDATAGQVQSALTSLASIGAGAVSVSGGPGDKTGSSPYLVTFTGKLADTDVSPLTLDTSGLRTEAGHTLSCAAGTAASGAATPLAVGYQWLRDGAEIPGAPSANYTTTGADTGKAVQCRVFFQIENNFGEQPASVQVSNPASIIYPHGGPEPPTAPATIATPTLDDGSIDFGGLGGQTLTCNPGSWTGAESFSYRWYRDGVLLSGANTTYTFTAADVATFADFQCAVTATNTGGSVTKVSEGTYCCGTRATSTVPNTLATLETITPGANFEECSASNCKIGVEGALPGQFSVLQPTRVREDSTGVIYTVENSGNFRVQKFTPQVGPPALSASIFAPELLTGSQQFGTLLNAPYDLSFSTGDQPVVAKMTPAGATPVCPNGSPSANEARLYELPPDGSGLLDTHGVCWGVVTATSGQNSNGALATNPISGDIYHSVGSGLGHRVYIFNTTTPPGVSLDTPLPTAKGAVVTGEVDPTAGSAYPNPSSTSHHVEYKLVSEAKWTTFGNEKVAGNGPTPVPFKTTIVGLQPNSEYEIRVVATKQFGSAQTISAPETITTLPSPPSIQAFSSSHVTASSADLHAVIDPQGSATKYRFEYGPTIAYGSSAPVPDEDIGSGNDGKAVEVHIENLESTTYHFRVVATSAAGTTVSPNQTFTFHPPSCPNAAVRQQTGANYLPDCRAYEIASAADSGGSSLYPSGGVNSGFATSPSRLGYMASFGAIPDTGETINTMGDFYAATRGSEGWNTKYIGLSATESAYSGPRPGWGGPPSLLGLLDKAQKDVLTNPEMSLFVLWNNGNPSTTPNPYLSNAPYVFDAGGNLVERWPTNLEDVAGGEAFKGEMRTSEDLTHFVFSSDIPFVEGAPAGAVYDNNIATGEISVISEAADESPIQAQPLEVSADGSHILMTTALITTPCAKTCPFPDGALYMRVGSVTYDVSDGAAVQFAGMTDDGSKVYFRSSDPLTTDDEDTSTDIFTWSESNPSAITRVSVGVGGAGNTDTCEAASVPAQPASSSEPTGSVGATKFRANWVSKCGAMPIESLEKSCPNPSITTQCDTYPRFFSSYAQTGVGVGGNGLSDNFVAAESGDLYFYSPEQLTGPGEGANDLQNLFLYRNGQVRFVATLTTETTCSGPTHSSRFCSMGPLARMQVSPDGHFAAFITKSQLTSFNNAGKPAMYLYDAVTEDLRCASCNPDGTPPTTEVLGSMNGFFMTDDGRAFFSTKDPLVTQDTNKGLDVYEYVDGRPQLISQGTGLTNADNPIIATPQAGLVGVSADGIDVFFATYDVLTPYDHNGGKLKIYDARTNGGFPFVEPPPRCVAADECHGDTSVAAPPLSEGSGAPLGTGKKTVQKKKKKKKRAKRQKQKHQKKSANRESRTGKRANG